MSIDPEEHQLNRIPVIPLWDYLIVPLQGDISDAQADRLTADVLDRIRKRSCGGLVIDLSGLWMVDSHLCAVLAHLAAAAELMGTTTIICGLNPEVAMTLQAMGVELGTVRTALSLDQGLEALGVRKPSKQAGTSTQDIFQWAVAQTPAGFAMQPVPEDEHNFDD